MQSRAKRSSQPCASGWLPPEDDFPLADSVCALRSRACIWFLCARCLKQFAYVFAYVHRQPKMYPYTSQVLSAKHELVVSQLERVIAITDLLMFNCFFKWVEIADVGPSI